MAARSYARKSTTIATRPTTPARPRTSVAVPGLIERQGWTLAEGHEYVDGGHERAVFNRPGLLR